MDILTQRLAAVVDELVRELKRFRESAARIVERLEDRGLIHFLDTCNGYSGPVAGVDGWLSLLGELGSVTIYVYRVVRVILENGSARLDASVEDVVYGSGVGEEDVRELAMFEMMEKEAKLAVSAKTPAVVLDGPLVDPPTPPRGRLASLKAAEYHKRRALMLASSQSSTLVVGYIKLPRTHSLAASLRVRIGDAELGEALLDHALKRSKACGAWLGPLPVTAPAVGSYRSLEPSYALLKLRWWSGVRGVEAPKHRLREAVELVVALTPHGAQHPVPVALAHAAAGAGKRLVDGLRMLLTLRGLHAGLTLHP